MLYATHLVSMLHPEPAWIDPSGVLKYTSSTYAIIFFCQIYETAGFNRQNIGSRGLEVYFCFLMAMSHIGLQSWRVTLMPATVGPKCHRPGVVPGSRTMQIYSKTDAISIFILK